MILILTKTQQVIFKSIIELLEDRKEEPSNKKSITINAYSIAKKSGKHYDCIKQNIPKLKEKLCELEAM